MKRVEPLLARIQALFGGSVPLMTNESDKANPYLERIKGLLHTHAGSKVAVTREESRPQRIRVGVKELLDSDLGIDLLGG